MQRRRVALLALLATAPDRTLARDRLLAILWPETDTAKGRHLLSGAVYDLRRSIGEERLISRGDQLALAEDGVWIDVAAFDAACGEGRHEDALHLRQGPFLDCFHLSRAHEFERWLDLERRRLDLRWREVLETAAIERMERGDPRGAVEAWRRLVAEDPCSGRATLGFMQALAAAGERAEALRVGEDHAVLLEEEFGADPHPDVAALADVLRTTPSGSIAPPSVRDPPPAVAAARDDDGREAERQERPPSSATGDSRGPRRRLLLAALAAIAVLAWGIAHSSSAPPPREGPTVVAVAPFALEGDTVAINLAWGMADLLSAKLNGAPGLRALDLRDRGPVHDEEVARAAAVDAGAHLVISGRIRARSEGLVIRARLDEARAGGATLGEAVVQGELSRVFDLVDDLVAQLVSRDFGGGDTLQLRRLASVTTESPLALRYYLEAERLVRWGKSFDANRPTYFGAREALERAVAIDSTFALAWYRLATMTTSDDGAIETARRALRHARRLPDPYPRLARAHLAASLGDADRAEALYRSVLADHHHLGEARWRLGDLLYQYNPLRGRPIAEAEAVLTEAARGDPNWAEGLGPLAWLAIQRGEYARADSLVAAAGFEPLHWRALTAVGGPEEAEVLAGLDSVLVWHRLPTALWIVPLRGTVDVARTILDRALAEAPAHEALEPIVRYQLAFVEAAAGRPAAALRTLADLERVDPRTAAETRAFLLLLPWWPASRQQLEASYEALADAPAAGRVFIIRGSPAARRASRECLLGRLAVAAGASDRIAEREATLDALRQAEFPAGEAAHDCLVLIRAERAAAAGAAPEEVLGILDRTRIRTEPRLGADPVHARVGERLLRARLLEAVGRADEALVWYHGLQVNPDLGWVPAMVAPVHLAMARIHDGRGQLVEAIRHYQWVVALWATAEAPFRDEAALVRERLRELNVP